MSELDALREALRKIRDYADTTIASGTWSVDDAHNVFTLADDALRGHSANRTIPNVTECYIFSTGGVNTQKRGEVSGTHGRTTSEVELAVGQRLVVTRGVDSLTLEVLPPPGESS